MRKGNRKAQRTHSSVDHRKNQRLATYAHAFVFLKEFSIFVVAYTDFLFVFLFLFKDLDLSETVYRNSYGPRATWNVENNSSKYVSVYL